MESQTLVDLFEEVIKNPELRERVVLSDGNRRWTLGQLDEESSKLGRYFVEKFGCAKGSVVGIYMNKCAEYVIAYIAALRAGGAYLPLDIAYPEGLLSSVLDEVTPIVVCTVAEHSSRLPETTPKFVFGEDIPESSAKLPTNISADDTAYIVYSSGTTGKPKGIACPHRGAVVSYKFRFNEYPYENDDIVACNVFFVWELFRPILKGIHMAVIPDDVIYDPTRLCTFLLEKGITRMLFTPSLLETVLDTQKNDVLSAAFARFRVIHLCGEVVTTALLSRIMRHFGHIKVINLYSISETHDVAVCDLNEFHRRGEERKFAPVGRMIPGVKVLILDSSQRRVPIGVPGEIFVAGPTLALGYVKRPELDKNRFLKVPTEYRNEIGSDRMYRTGDWGYVLPNSVLEICGRCDTLVRIRGYGVELQAIEASLLMLSNVSSCAVVSIGAEGDDKQLAAYIVLRKPITRKNLRAELKKLLPFYMVPHFFVFMDKLPVVATSSKIDHKALPNVDYERDVVEAEALPQSQTERRLAKIWADILQHSAVDIQESFFDLGGHSLLASRLLAKVDEEFGVQLGMRDLFAAPTVFEMARILDGSERTSPEQIVDLDIQVDTHDLKDEVMDLHLRAFWRSTGVWGNRFVRSNILLTGATGFLGAHVLNDLLTKSQANVICLVRESRDESTESRLKGALKRYGLWSETFAQLVRDRVRIFAADVALVRLGLNDETYTFLTYEIDVVVHCAAYVNLIYPYQALHGINVLGTRNILDFCHANRIKPLHYISTDAVIPSGLTNVDEDFDLTKTKDRLRDGYGQSKYVAEQLVKRFVRILCDNDYSSTTRGLPAIIYRLGNQTSSTASAEWNESDFLFLMIQSVLCLGRTPKIDWIVEGTPVDFSAKFIGHLVTRDFCENVGKIFHLTNSCGPKWSDFVEWFRINGYDLGEVEFRVLKGNNPTLQHFQRLMQGIIGDESYFSTQSSYRRSNTDELISRLGWIYPKLDERLITEWLQLMADRQRIPKPNLRMGSLLLHKVCIVTGASEGIGEAIVRGLAAEGANVVMASRQINRLKQISADLVSRGVNSTKLLTIGCDVTDRSAVQNLILQTVKKFSKIDVLVNCAGCMYYCMLKNGYTNQFQQQIDVNCHGTLNVTMAVLTEMIPQKSGHIINITSDAGKRGFAGLAVYSGSKFFIEGFSQALRQEMIEYNIRVTNIQPGDVSTKLAGRSTDAEAIGKYDFSKAGHKILQPVDVAKTVVFVATQSDYVSLNEILIEPQAAPI